MVVENDADMRELLRTALTIHGCEVATFNCCVDAMKDLNCHSYDLAIIDLGLPVVSGISCAEKMRFECPEMYLMAYTAYPEAVEPDYILEQAGFNACFRKGDEPQRLINAVLKLGKERDNVPMDEAAS